MENRIRTILEDKLGRIERFERVSGGDINQAARFEMEGKKYFVKWCEEKIPGMFRAEAAGLEALRRVGVVSVPEVVMVEEECLVLEWLDLVASSRYQVLSERKLGKNLAKMHRHIGEKFGFPMDNYIGKLPQRNDEMESWSEFWWKMRFLPQLEIAENRMKNEEYRNKDVREKLLELKKKLPELLPERPEVSLLHGDLWSGNWSVLDTGEPVVYDPAVYFGDREVDLAMTRLFGGFGKGFYKAYETEWPLREGWEDRMELYQLYPLMVHWNLFGGSYEAQVERVLGRYV